MKRLVLAIAIAAFAVPALAQTPHVPDQRTVVQTINALQAMLTLREAEEKAMQEDAQKREKDWAAYSAPLWQTPSAPKE